MSHQANINIDEAIMDMNGVQETLDSLKDKKMPSKTLFGDLNGIVPKPYSKFQNMENPL